MKNWLGYLITALLVFGATYFYYEKVKKETPKEDPKMSKNKTYFITDIIESYVIEGLNKLEDPESAKLKQLLLLKNLINEEHTIYQKFTLCPDGGSDCLAERMRLMGHCLPCEPCCYVAVFRGDFDPISLDIVALTSMKLQFFSGNELVKISVKEINGLQYFTINKGLNINGMQYSINNEPLMMHF